MAENKGIPPEPDLYRLVITFLGIAVLGALAGSIYLTAVGEELPEILLAVASAAVGALAGLLAPSPS